MSTKLTKAQADLLAKAAVIAPDGMPALRYQNFLKHFWWLRGGGEGDPKVNRATASVLAQRGLIERYEKDGWSVIYRLTEAGRQALSTKETERP